MAPQKLHIDIETYSSEDIAKAGAYKYLESLDFEILLVAYAFNGEGIHIVDLAQGETLPDYFIKALQDPTVEKHAHNAVFERQAFKQIGYDVPTEQWYCSAVKAAYCGLPLSLGDASKALELEEKGKSSTGKALIRYFCCPVKATKVNGQRTRNFPHHDPEKWGEFKAYCIQDVEAEREIDNRLKGYNIPNAERAIYLLDQAINDRGILIDLDFAKRAFEINGINSEIILKSIKDLTGLDNPNSPAQLKEWLSKALQKEVKSLAKDIIPTLIEEAGAGPVSDVLALRQKASKTSIKKYDAMLNCTCSDGRAHGLFQFYGASRTGRWAGRLIQLQNLPQNHIDELELAREVVADGDYDLASLLYDDIASLLSQLIRTAFVAKPGYTFAVADFSAIEARVIAWLADEKWRLDVFKTHGKIYEASASMMFNVPIEKVTKGSDLRSKGKIAELALGYQGAVGAMKQMGGEAMGLSEEDMRQTVTKWRQANRFIVRLWFDVEQAAIRAVETRKPVILPKGLVFNYDGYALTIKLPSGRKLFYKDPSFTTNSWGARSLQYKGMVQATHQWGYVDTYGGKLVENIVQGIARDLLAYSMLRLDGEGFDIVMHVHDESICEVPAKGAAEELDRMCEIMGEPVPWAPGLPLEADGYITPFYKKD